MRRRNDFNKDDQEKPETETSLVVTRLFGRFFRLPLILALNGFVDFLAMNRDFCWGFDSQTHLIAANIDDRDLDVVADENAFISLS